MNNFLLQEFLGNTMEDYGWFIGAILLGLIFKRLISKYLTQLLLKIVKNNDSDLGLDKFNELLTKPISLCIMLSIIYLGSAHIQYPPAWNLAPDNELGIKMLISKGFSLIFIYSIFWILLKMIDFVGLILLKKAELTDNKMDGKGKFEWPDGKVYEGKKNIYNFLQVSLQQINFMATENLLGLAELFIKVFNIFFKFHFRRMEQWRNAWKRKFNK